MLQHYTDRPVLCVVPRGAAAATCNLLDEAEKKVTALHEEYRQKVAKKTLDESKYGKLKGSSSLFELKYDCTHENLAVAVITAECTQTPLNLTLLGKGVNFVDNLVSADPTGQAAEMEALMEYAVNKWAQVKSPLSSDAIYNDEIRGEASMEQVLFNFGEATEHLKLIIAYTQQQYTLLLAPEAIVVLKPFPNSAPVYIINYRSLKFGCHAKWCANSKILAIACVYSDVPRKGEALYLANSNTGDGCTKDSTCQKVVKADGKCDMAKGLCTSATADSIDSTTAKTTTTTTTTAASSPPPVESSSSSATTTVTTEGLTSVSREKIVSMHNWRRSQLAKGNVRNGKEGKANFRTAMNMFEMRYDEQLEKEAQAFANLCQKGSSSLSSRPNSGENTYFTTSTTIGQLDVVVEGIKSWWKVIRSVGINYQMLYTQNIENKAIAPLGFTQMAWAASYKIGCGVRRCPSGTVLVCRYSPRGNIYNQYIYNVGTLCGSCASSCKDGLCPAPAS